MNVMGANAPEWAIAFFGGIFRNNVVSGVYITNGPDACKYQAQHSEAQVIACDSIDQMKVWYRLLPELPLVKAIVVWGVDLNPNSPDKVTSECAKDPRIYTWKKFLSLGANRPDQEIQ